MRIVNIQETIVIRPIRADVKDYYFYAFNLRHNHSYSRQIPLSEKLSGKIRPDALRTPGYPIFLLPFVSSFPSHHIIRMVTFFQAVISTLAILIAFIGFRRMMPERYCIAVCGLMALSPHLIIANVYLLTETVFGFIVILLVWNITKFFRAPSMMHLFVAGIVMGIGILIRSSIQFFPFFLIPFWVLHYGKLKGLRFFAITVFGIALILTPWYVRNIINLGIITDDTLKISWVQHGMYPNFMYKNMPESYGYPYKYDPKTKEITRSPETILREIYRCFKDEPVAHIKWFFYQKIIAFWSWDNVQGQGDAFFYSVGSFPYFYRPAFIATHTFMYFLHWPLIILCYMGCFLIWFPSSNIGIPDDSIKTARFVSYLLLYYTLIHMIGAPWPRYSVPLRPFAYGMAVFYMYFSFQLYKKHRSLSKQNR